MHRVIDIPLSNSSRKCILLVNILIASYCTLFSILENKEKSPIWIKVYIYFKIFSVLYNFFSPTGSIKIKLMIAKGLYDIWIY